LASARSQARARLGGRFGSGTTGSGGGAAASGAGGGCTSLIAPEENIGAGSRTVERRFGGSAERRLGRRRVFGRCRTHRGSGATSRATGSNGCG
jgi:hypothetical protein